MPHTITKSEYLSSLRCIKKLWREVHNPASKPAPGADARMRMEEGQQVGKAARQRYSDAVFVQTGSQEEMIVRTEHLMASGARVLFEAAFQFNSTYCKPDILERDADGWNLIEVKAAKNLKDHPEYVDDLAFQYYCVSGSGVAVKRCILRLLNPECKYPDLSDLFADHDLTQAVLDLQPEVKIRVEAVHRALDAAEPKVRIGKHCKDGDECQFLDECWRDVPPVSIFDINGLKWDKKDNLIERGILAAGDVPNDFKLSDKQARELRMLKAGKEVIDEQSIRAELNHLQYPLHFFDFETLSPAIPRFDGMGPISRFPFQYSCHILSEDGTITHREYLHRDKTDPRRAVAEHMLETLGRAGTIVAYYATYEKGVIKELAETFDDLASDLMGLHTRIWDQLDVFKNHYLHPGFHGSNSIKSVLPVIVPALSYDRLELVHDGTEAQAIFERAIRMPDCIEREMLFQALLDYCRLDSLAMVEIHRHLMTVCAQPVA